MKLVVFSDAHGNKQAVERIINYNKDTDYLISLGDSELPLSFLQSKNIIMIKGNYPLDAGFKYCDWILITDCSARAGLPTRNVLLIKRIDNK